MKTKHYKKIVKMNNEMMGTFEHEMDKTTNENDFEILIFNIDLNKCAYHFAREKHKYLLSKKIRYLRRQYKLSVEEVSFNLKLSVATYIAYEEGIEMPLCRMIKAISDFYSVSLDYLRNDDIEIVNTRKIYNFRG